MSYGPKPKKAVLVTPFRHVSDDGKPYWKWPGVEGVSHVYKLDGALEQVIWEVWLEDTLLASTTLFHRGRSEAEHYILWSRHMGLDAIGANRLLRANGYLATQHLDLMESCNCDLCEPTTKEGTL